MCHCEPDSSRRGIRLPVRGNSRYLLGLKQSQNDKSSVFCRDVNRAMNVSAKTDWRDPETAAGILTSRVRSYFGLGRLVRKAS